MPVTYNFKKGIDLPAWQWLAFFPGGNSNPGTSNVYDGSRYIYWSVQTGTTTVGTASTTTLYRYDTYSNGWQYLANLTNGNNGIDLEYDSARNLVYILTGNAATAIQVFNLNTTAVTVFNQSCAAWSLTTIALALPAGAAAASSITMPYDGAVANPIDTGTSTTGGSTTSVIATTATGTFGQGMVGLQLRVTSGAQSGSIRTISAVTAPTTLTLSSALGGALSAGDTFVIEQQSNTAASATTTTLTAPANVAWTTNMYSNMDVVILSGTAAGQRRRIASNTANVLTLAGAVTGNSGTGAFGVTPDATSVYRIVPSNDFLYYQVGGSTALWKIDVVATTGTAWVSLTAAPAATGGGANTFWPSQYAPYQIIALRGIATSTVYFYNIGLNSWTTLTTYAGSETFTTGASATMVPGKRKLIIQKEGTTRLYIYDLLTGILEPAGTMVYAAPAAYDGHRARVLTSPDGAQFLYILRAGGAEFFRVPLEWL